VPDTQETARWLIGSSSAMFTLRKRLEQVARVPLPVLLVGETGTGKEVAARALHAVSGRRGSFIPVDCAAISPSLVETELFGHERGAFTGASHSRDGLVHAAEGGTFFLDEIADLPGPAQTRLLRLLQESTYRPVGANDERRADLRVVAASWKDLRHAVHEGRFREDLYHRLAVVELTLPPLRDHIDDLDELLAHFLEDAAREAARSAPRPSASALAFLRRWPWPGNVRELRNVARYVCAFAKGDSFGPDDLPPQLHRAPPAVQGGGAPRTEGFGTVRIDLPYMESRRVWLDEFQRRYVSAQLDAHEGNVSAAARAAGMDRRSIQRIMARVAGSGSKAPHES
jgi:DNA-binding NtrC family response regulator